MSFAGLTSGPALSTPERNIFDAPKSVVDAARHAEQLSDEKLYTVYEIERTVAEIRSNRWKRIALQFPDLMLVDAPRVYQALSRGLKQARKSASYDGARLANSQQKQSLSVDGVANISEDLAAVKLLHHDPLMPKHGHEQRQDQEQEQYEEKLAVLADTSYGSCCVDEVAAEHADADVVVHYGRSCLSPTARLPVIYVFTRPDLDVDKLANAFQTMYPRGDEQVILMADTPYQPYVAELAARLGQGAIEYKNVFATSLVHNTLSPLPNRTVPESVTAEPSMLQAYQLFHISEPPSSLVLALSNRVAGMEIYTTKTSLEKDQLAPGSTAAVLRRRYAMLTQVSRVPIIGILINTLTVKNYMTILNHLKKTIAAAGKKSYTFVVGKINAAKVANFSEVGGWVVIGCWESSLFDNKDFWKPVITPWELEMALKSDDDRVWTGEWEPDYQTVLNFAHTLTQNGSSAKQALQSTSDADADADGGATQIEYDEDESEPPEFDLRTGRYVSQTRPMGPAKPPNSLESSTSLNDNSTTSSLIRRSRGDVAVIAGEVSPAADFFRNKRTWQGLGSDFEIEQDKERSNGEMGAPMEQGRRGIAKGYVVGENTEKS